MTGELRKNFHHDLEQVHHDLVRLSGTVTELIARTTSVLLRSDLEGADYVVAGDDEIDARSLDIDDACLTILALQAPVAVDLRRVVAMLAVSADVERSADLLCNICKAIGQLSGAVVVPVLSRLIAAMGERAGVLFLAATECLRDDDAAKAWALDDMDSYLDELHRQLIQAIFETYTAGQIDVSAAVQLAFVARFYERVGDHAVNIGEHVSYVVTGSRHAQAQGIAAQRGQPVA